MISLPGCTPSPSRRTARYFSRRSRPFQFGMTTEAEARSGIVSRTIRRLPNRDHKKSEMATAAIGINQKRRKNEER